MAENRKPSARRPPDVEIGATVRADSLRFSSRPETEVRFRGRSIAESDSGSRRENLPGEVEPGVTYRNVRVGWNARAWVENAVDLPDDEAGEAGEDGAE